MSSPNPFEVLEAEEQSVEIALRNYGWIGRRQFCLFLTGLLLMQFMCVTALRGAQSLTAVLLIVGVGAVLLALQMLVAALRLQHIGYGRLWVWVLLVPPLNAVILLQCITAAKGCHQHSKYDTGGLIGLAVLLGCLMTLGGLLVVVWKG